MRGMLSAAIFLLSSVWGACGGSGSSATTAPTPPPGQIWADEFSGPANSAPDPTKWTYDLGAGGWGNQELETYTNSPDNVRLDGQGHLIIRAVSAGGMFSSARLKTQGRFTAQYGHLEASIKLPVGRGIWPAV